MIEEMENLERNDKKFKVYDPKTDIIDVLCDENIFRGYYI